jgi:hypothetical protein
MAGINVNQITSTLAGLPDQALQQYAAMHKNDPYIMSLAVSESNRRKELRAAGQGAQGMQPQPKVADAAIAQMGAQPMPEEMGIGQLPAQNMQQMADGGIAGYEGYDEGGMAYGQEPVMMMAEGGVARYQAGGGAQSLTGDIPGFVAGTSIFQTQPRPAEDEPLFRRWAREFGESTEAKRVQEARIRALKGQPLSAEDQARIANADKTKAAADMSAQDMAQFDAASNLYMTERAAKQAAAKPKPAAPAAAKADTGRKASAPRAPAARPAAPAQSDAARFMAMQKAMGVDGGQGLDTAQKELSSALMEAAESNEREVEKGIAARGKAGEGREARLNKREAGMGAQKSELQGLALLEAGLAIMSTPGKLAEAVGKGAQAGLKTYSAGVKDLRAAQEKLDEARDQLEELRRNEDNMTAKERREARQGVKAAQVKGKELGLQAAEKMYGYKRADANAIFAVESQGLLTDKEIQGRKEAGQIAAGPGYERNKMLKAAQGDEAKLRAEYGKLQAKVMDTLSKDANYQTANPAMQSTMYTNALRQAVSTNPFLASYASGIGFSAAPTGKVYDLTED